MPNSSKTITSRLNRAMALFVSMPMLAAPAMAGELEIRAGVRERRTVRSKVSGRISVRTQTTGRVGIRIERPTLEKSVVSKTIQTGVRTIGK